MKTTIVCISLLICTGSLIADNYILMSISSLLGDGITLKDAIKYLCDKQEKATK